MPLHQQLSTPCGNKLIKLGLYFLIRQNIRIRASLSLLNMQNLHLHEQMFV